MRKKIFSLLSIMIIFTVVLCIYPIPLEASNIKTTKTISQKVYNITTAKVAIYKKAGSGKITTINKGAIVEKLKSNKKYTCVKYNGYVGYISTRYLKNYVIPKPKAPVKTYLMPKSNVTLFKNVGSKKIATIPKGTKLEKLGTNKAYTYVSYNKNKGYVPTKSLVSFTSQKTQPKVTPKPTKTYTGSQVKQKLYGLGFTNHNSGLKYNPYGANGDDAYNYATFQVNSGNLDMSLLIEDSNAEFDQTLRTILGYILPSSGGTLYSILDNPNVGSQSINLDGRNINIDVRSYGIAVKFSPIIK